jgi:hypothetical protein
MNSWRASALCNTLYNLFSNFVSNLSHKTVLAYHSSLTSLIRVWWISTRGGGRRVGQGNVLENAAIDASGEGEVYTESRD